MKAKEGFLFFFLFLMESVKPNLFPSVPLLHHREVITSILREGWGVLERQCLGVCAHSAVQISSGKKLVLCQKPWAFDPRSPGLGKLRAVDTS